MSCTVGRRGRVALAIAAAGGWAVSLPSARAADITWAKSTPGGGDFNLGANWTGGVVPGVNDVADISNAGTANILGGETIGVNALYAGSTTGGLGGSVNQSGGTLNVTSNLAVGFGGTTGDYNMTGGTINMNASGGGAIQLVGVAGNTQSATMEVSGNSVINAFGGDPNTLFGNGPGGYGFGALVSFEVGVGTTASGSGSGHLYISGNATINSTNQFLIGGCENSSGTGGTGIVDMSGGTLNVSDYLAVGWYSNGDAPSSGTLNLSGGTINILATNGGAFVVSTLGGTGVVNQTGGTVNSPSATIQIGADGSGIYNLSGGSMTTGSTLLVGLGAATANLNVMGGSVSADDIQVGLTSGLGGAIYQSGPTSVVGNTDPGQGGIQIGTEPGAFGYYNLSGGTLNVAGEIDVGGVSGGNGTFGQFDMTGGTVNLPSSYFLVNRAIANITETGVVNITGGTVQLPAGNTIGNVYYNGFVVNWGGSQTATVTIAGSGQVLIPTLTAKLNWGQGELGYTGNVATLNLNGGTFQTAGFGSAVGNPAGFDANAVLNFNGGTLKAGSMGNTTFVSDLGAVNVYRGGGTIDNNGQAITISQPILAATGSGVSAVSVATAGSGYDTPPQVVFSGGTLANPALAGSGATGYATVDPVSGAVTGIVITNPGSYASTAGLTVSLVGGGSGAALGTPTLASNGSGRLIFAGTGTTTLSAVSTYTGPTNISAGTLALSTSGTNPIPASSKILVSAGATLDVTAVSGGFALASGQTLAGSGTVAGGTTIGTGSTITAGTGATAADALGHLTTAAQTWAGGTYAVKLDGSHSTAAAKGSGGSGATLPAGTYASDELILGGLATGSTALAINPVLVNSGSFTTGSHYSYVIADDTASTTPHSTTAFDGLALSSITVTPTSGGTYSLSTASDGTSSGEDLILDFTDTAAAPEPTSLLLAGAAAAPMVLGRRRQRRPAPAAKA